MHRSICHTAQLYIVLFIRKQLPCALLPSVPTYGPSQTATAVLSLPTEMLLFLDDPIPNAEYSAVLSFLGLFFHIVLSEFSGSCKDWHDMLQPLFPALQTWDPPDLLPSFPKLWSIRSLLTSLALCYSVRWLALFVMWTGTQALGGEGSWMILFISRVTRNLLTYTLSFSDIYSLQTLENIHIDWFIDSMQKFTSPFVLEDCTSHPYFPPS